jgi:6-pyruvoyl-tetrahydropterin synthase
VLETRHLSVSLAHSYFLESLSHEDNLRLFGRSISPEGLGHNFDVAISFLAETSESIKQNVLDLLKNEWDHSSKIDAKGAVCTSLEVLTWRMVQKIYEHVEKLEVTESRRLSVTWDRHEGSSLSLTYGRSFPVLWKEGGGGARLNFQFIFKDQFFESDQVLVPRSLLEGELEEYFESLGDLRISKNVKDNESIMDALFKSTRKHATTLDSMVCEIENQRKWLIHAPNLSR